MVKAILFDLDGVLVDACDYHYEALNRALLESPYAFVISPQEHDAVFNGLPTKEKLRMLVHDRRIKPHHWKEIEDKKQRYTRGFIESLPIDLEKVRLHKQLKSLNLKIACVTNSIRSSAETMLTKTGQMTFMDLLISNEDVSLPKPSSEGYVKAMFILGVHPYETLIVEDSPKGIQAARDSGARVLEVKNAVEVTWETLSTFLSLSSRPFAQSGKQVAAARR